MRKVHVYLPSDVEQDAECLRWKHLTSQIDREFCEVRVFTCGLDFKKSEAKYELPYCIEQLPNKDKKVIEFEDAFQTYIINTGKAEDGYITHDEI
jgi:hypothetical protein